MIAFNFFKTLYIPYQTFETVFTTPVCPMSYVMYHLSCVMCHMSCVICHISQVTCHMSYVTCHKSHVKKKIWWSFLVEGLLSTDLPRLVSSILFLLQNICITDQYAINIGILSIPYQVYFDDKQDDIWNFKQIVLKTINQIVFV